MADKTDKVKAMIEKNTDKLTDIQDKVDKIIEITSHLKWLGRDTKTTDDKDEEEEEDNEEEVDCSGKEDCECQSCREYDNPDLEVEERSEKAKGFGKKCSAYRIQRRRRYHRRHG